MNKLVKKSCFGILTILTLSNPVSADSDLKKDIRDLMVLSYMLGCAQALPLSSENYKKCEESSEKFRIKLSTSSNK